MSDSQQVRPVVFAGENPILQLYQAGSDQYSAVASIWRATYSEQGVGYVLFLWIDPASSGLGDDAVTGVYTDNADLTRLVWTNFNQHFGSFQNRGFDQAAPQPARFTEDAGGRRSHRITCAAGPTIIDLHWRDVQDVFHNTGPAALGGTDWIVTNVVCPAARAAITVNGNPVAGEVRQTGTTFQSSAFLAFCESWVKRD